MVHAKRGRLVASQGGCLQIARHMGFTNATSDCDNRNLMTAALEGVTVTYLLPPIARALAAISCRCCFRELVGQEETHGLDEPGHQHRSVCTTGQDVLMGFLPAISSKDSPHFGHLMMWAARRTNS